MNKYAITAALAMVSLFSCRKDKNTIPDPAPIIDSPVVYPSYTKLLPGNYWIYQDYKLDSINGDAHPLGTFDSVYVEKDTIINGYNYHKYCDVDFSGGGHTYSYLRDSLSYLVNLEGQILFSSTDFTNVFRTYTVGPSGVTADTVTATEQMGFKDALVTVAAGTFKTSTFRKVFHYTPYYPYGTTREYDYRYSLGVGLVSYTNGFYSMLPEVYERRLVRYHVL